MRKTPPPLHRSLSDSLRASIESGEYAIGSLLPPESDLSEQYGVSRHTVRQAMRSLADSGLISRRAGIGTTVVAKSVSARYTATLGSLAEFLQFTQTTRLEVLSTQRIKASKSQASKLKCRVNQPWVRLRTLRFPTSGEQRPLSYTDIYLLPEFEGILRYIRSGTQTIFSLIEEHGNVHITEVLQDIGACSIQAPIARLLQVRSGSPGLSVHRHYLGAGGKPLAISLNTYEEHLRVATRWRLHTESK